MDLGALVILIQCSGNIGHFEDAEKSIGLVEDAGWIRGSSVGEKVFR